MSDTTKIQWAAATFNPVEGCTKVSPGCAHCYAAARNHRFGMDNWGPGKPRRRTSAANWKKPLAWEKKSSAAFRRWDLAVQNLARGDERELLSRGFIKPERPRIFPSLCDWLDAEWPIEVLADFLKLIHDTPNLDWLLLTKRPENWLSRMQDVLAASGEHDADDKWPHEGAILAEDWFIRGNTPANIWLGTSVEDQRRADERIAELLAIPAKVRFLSVEPLLESVNIRLGSRDEQQIHERHHLLHWVIVGGESGPGARACSVEWIRSILGQCRSAAVPCFVKQLGSRPFFNATSSPLAGPMDLELNHPKGGDPAEWPEDLRVREFPKP